MLTLTEIESEIADINEKIKPLERRQQELKRARDKLLSQEFIRVNKITRSDVQHSQGDGLPWWGDFYKFGEWLKETGSTKRFCEWNGCLHFTADAMIGVMRRDTPGRMEDVP